MGDQERDAGRLRLARVVLRVAVRALRPAQIGTPGPPQSPDDFNREGFGIEVDLSLPAARVIRSLDRIIEWRGKPRAIRRNNGPEYISGALQRWDENNGIKLDYIQPVKPQQNVRRALQLHSAVRLEA